MTIQTDTTYIAPVKRKATATDAKYPGWVCALILFALIVATWSAIYFLVTAAREMGR